MKDQIIEAHHEIMAIFGRIPMTKLDRLWALTVAMATVMDDTLQDIPNGEIGLRVGRRSLHAFPEAITKFLQVWQPGNIQVASKNLFDTLASRLMEDTKNAPELRRSLHRS